MEFYKEDLFKLLVALILGGLVGAEREYRGKTAGFRTTIMICIGSTLFTMVSGRIGTGDGRIAANIVNGIGFLGAGIIFKEDNRVRGLTTAATIWAVSALGMCIGSGHYDIALVGFGIVLGSLVFMVGVADRIGRLNQTREYRVVTTYQNKTLAHYERVFEDSGLRPRRGPQQRIGNEISGRWSVAGPQEAHEKCILQLLSDPEVKEFVF